MTGIATAAFAVQDHLLACARAVVPYGWEVDYGLPGIRAERHVWVDEQIEDQDQQILTTGEVVSEELFRVYLYVYAREAAASALELRDVVAPIAGLICDRVNADATLGGRVQAGWCFMSGYDGAFADPEGRIREAALRLSVRVDAVLL